MSMKNLRCEYQVNPLGIDTLKPRLSWEIRSDKRGVMQDSYHILVASSPELVEQGEPDVWDSGVVRSDQSIQVEYAGPSLESKTRYFWNVRVTTSDGAELESAVASWSMGILEVSGVSVQVSERENPDGPARTLDTGTLKPETRHLKASSWQARWIGLQDDTSADRYDHEIPEGELTVIKAVLKGQDGAIDVTAILAAKIARGMLGTTCTPEALGVEDPGGRKQLTVEYEYNGKPYVKRTPSAELLGDIYLPDATMYMDTPVGQEERRRWPVPRQLRREFEVDQPVTRATLYATALGLYEFRLNGQRVGDQLLAPEWTDYHKRVQGQTYDVTDLVRTGANVMGALLGNGWYCGGWMCWQRQLKPIYGKDPSLLAQLELEYADGSTQTVATDEAWRGTADGPIRFSGIFEGEIYDARREMPGWDQPGFSALGWKPVVVRGDHLKVGQLVWQRSEPIRKTQEITPVAISEPNPGVYVADMGQVFSGWTRLRVDVPKDTRITMQHGEILNPDGTVYIDNLRAGHFGTGDRQVDRYFCKGGGEEAFEPHFTYHGFQFVEIHGLARRPTPEDVTGIVFHTDFGKQSQFTCSNALLTKFVQNIQWSMRANIMGIPTDCNQRDERCGYTGDMNFFMPAAAYNFDLSAFFNKWLADVKDAQNPGGWFPDHAPFFGPGPGPNVGWSDAGVLCVYRMFREYADTRIIEDHYPSMVRALDHLIRTTNPDGTRGGGDEMSEWRIGLTDHAKAEGGNKVSLLTTGTAYLAHNAHVMAEMAAVIGKQEDASRYRALAEQTRKAFAEKLIDEDGRVDSDSQTGYTLAFTMGLVPEEKKALVSQRFGERIEKVGHIATGFMGCPRVLQGLDLAGRPQDAYQLLLNEGYPSWLYMARYGTTIWEHFDSRKPDGSPHSPYMNSFSHYAHGAAGAFVFSHIGGIRPETPGYKRIIIKPVIEKGLDWANTRYDSIHGPIETRWNITGGVLTLNVTIPPNTTATVHVLAGDAESVTESGQPVAQAEEVRLLERSDHHVVFEVGSGQYEFISKGNWK